MAIGEKDVLYDPQDLKEQIIAALTPAQLARIREYCNMSGVTKVTVNAEYGPPAQIYIRNSDGQGAATPLPSDSKLATTLRELAMA